MVGPRQSNRVRQNGRRIAPAIRIGNLAGLLLLVVGLSGCAGPAPRDQVMDSADEIRQWEADAADWRARRLARLTEPFGWLSLVALEYLEDGRWQLGSAEDNDFVLPSGPEHWGTLTILGDQAWFEVEPGSSVSIDGNQVSESELLTDGPDGPTLVEAGTIQFQLLDRAGQFALRVRDHQAPTRTGFAGLDYFPFNPDWRITARWVPHPPGSTLLVANVLGELINEPNPGAAEFQINGRDFGLEAVASDDQLFFILADRTSGRETYGLGRFLYSDLPENGQVVLDFNRTYNPPCAFTEFSTCPLPPPENRLDIRIEAGELAPLSK